MTNGIREFLKGPAGKVIAVVVFAAAMVVLFFAMRGTFGDTVATRQSIDRVFVCAQTGKSFQYELKRGDTIPVQSPHSGDETGYPAELCYWTADGNAKSDPTPVLLNQRVGKPGPTFCPDCGRLVVAMNPPPAPGMKPPATKDQYAPTSTEKP